MRVTIKHIEERNGFVFKRTYHSVVCQVLFTELEKQIIRQRRLEQNVIMERIPAGAKPDDDPSWYWLRIKNLLRGPDKFICLTPLDAKNYEDHLTAQLRTLKSYLEGNTDPGTEKTFEL